MGMGRLASVLPSLEVCPSDSTWKGGQDFTHIWKKPSCLGVWALDGLPVWARSWTFGLVWDVESPVGIASG